MMTEIPQPEKPEPVEEYPPSGPAALEDVALRAAELSEYLGAMLRAKKEGLGLEVRKALKSVVATVLLMLIGAGALLTGVVFVFYGAAEGLTLAFGGRPWLAYLVSGAVPIAATIVFLKFFILSSGKSRMKENLRSYETELKQQRARFGHDATERASQWAAR